MRTHSPAALAMARRLRGRMSLPEILLWQVLRHRPDGLKFRKQHPFGAFVADFYCASARLIVEVDGDAHSHGDRPARDLMRDRFFRTRGMQVLRIPARDVLADLDAAVRHIVDAARMTTPPPSGLRPATSPDGGGIVVEH